MIYIAFFVLAFTFIQLLVAVVNLLFREKLRNAVSDIQPLVSVLIPARNEEKNIENILNDLIRQDYSRIEIIVFDDQSEDKTQGIVKNLIPVDNRIRLIKSDGLPPGWTGKNYACHILSGNARGDYFLFLDADVRLGNGIITRVLSFSERYQAVLVSIFPRQIIKSPGEWATVPVMNYILLSLLPLVLVRKSAFPSLAAANGQFMFFKASVYHSVKPHELLKNNMVEDIETARILKRRGYRISCLTGDSSLQCRMYTNISDAINGFAKNVSAFFGNSFLLSVIFWFLTTLGFIPVLISMNTTLFLAYIAAIISTRIIVSIVSEQNRYLNLLYFIPQQLTCGLFIYKAFIIKYFRKYRWKGRSI